jgi:hypothetical protein
MFDKRTSASLLAAFLFLIIGSPLVYNLTNKLLGSILKTSSNGCATCNGLVLHAIVFGLLSYLLMSVSVPKISSTSYIIAQDKGVSNVNETSRHPPVTPPHLPAQLAAEMGPKMM